MFEFTRFQGADEVNLADSYGEPGKEVALVELERFAGGQVKFEIDCWRGEKIEMRLLMLWTLMAVSANTGLWQRHILTGTGETFDTPRPHGLAYFTEDAFLRDEGNDFCDDCTPSGKAKVHRQHRFKTELKEVGRLKGFTIYDLYYRFDGNVDRAEIDWKSILVEVSPGSYREIYHLQPTNALIKPSFIGKAGSEQLLVTHDEIPGTGNFSYEDYFWFSPAGAARVNIEEIGRTVQALLPKGYGVWKGGGLDIETMKYRWGVWKDGDANCCPSGGTVEMEFRLEENRIVVTKSRYDPKAEFGE